MNFERTLQQWQISPPSGAKKQDVEKFLKYFGFVFDGDTRHGHQWSHPLLEDAPGFEQGFIRFSSRASGNSNEVYNGTLRNIAKAAQYVYEREKELNTGETT